MELDRFSICYYSAQIPNNYFSVAVAYSVLGDGQTALSQEEFGTTLREGLHSTQGKILFVQSWVRTHLSLYSLDNR